MQFVKAIEVKRVLRWLRIVTYRLFWSLFDKRGKFFEILDSKDVVNSIGRSVGGGEELAETAEAVGLEDTEVVSAGEGDLDFLSSNSAVVFFLLQYIQ